MTSELARQPLPGCQLGQHTPPTWRKAATQPAGRQWWGVQRVRQEARGDHDRSSSQSTSDVAACDVCGQLAGADLH